MRLSIITSAAFAALVASQSPETGALGNATVTTGNPLGVVYKATLPAEAFSYPGPQGNIKGSISSVANADGTGLTWKVDFSNLPTTGGPFLYHVHVAPVGEDGNCTKTLAHLDPYIRGEATPCDPTLPQTCQVGDLSGKHGKITSDPFQHTYQDLYTTTIEGVGSFHGNRSIVIHFANKTRITCANFVGTHLTVNGTSNGTTPTSTPIPYVPGSSGVNNMASMLYVFSVAGLLALVI